MLRRYIREAVADMLLDPQDRKEYLAWKRKNVSFRGLSNADEEKNGGGARFGSGLYTAALSNKSMAKYYGTVYYVVNAVPKNPIVFKDANAAEIWIGNTLMPMYLGKMTFPDSRKFYEMTTLEDAIMKLGYDGLVIQGREMSITTLRRMSGITRMRVRWYPIGSCTSRNDHRNRHRRNFFLTSANPCPQRVLSTLGPRE